MTAASMISGGHVSYGHVAGILMGDATIPRIPGDPGHAQTFSFPVCYGQLKGFPFEDLVSARMDRVNLIVDAAMDLEQRGVRFIAADCGLFGPFQEELSRHIGVPFIGSALDLVPMLARHAPVSKKIGIITGHTGILGGVHLQASGINPDRVVISGMEGSEEFERVVIRRAQTLDVEEMRQGAVEAAKKLARDDMACVVLECTNLISFRSDIQQALNLPVYDLLTLIEFYASGFARRSFDAVFI